VLALAQDEARPRPQRILELGTGSGAIILALASEHAAQAFYASDVSKQALKLASKNAHRLGWADKICFFGGNWFEPLSCQAPLFDIIVSNPPYIASAAILHLQPEIHCWEPRQALDGDQDGLKCLQHIIAQAHLHLAPHGYLVLEIGHDQQASVQKIINSCECYDSPTFKQDYGGYDRVALVRKKSIAYD
jgi:release factor glutamine methyltransferase